MSVDKIYESLNLLTGAVDYLEQELLRVEGEKAALLKEQQQQKEQMQKQQQQQAARTPAGKSLPGLPGQNDLFGDWTAPGGHPANVNAAAALAKKLDNAIENVQWLLKAGA